MGIIHKVGGEGGIRTLDGLLTHTPLAGERLQPLGHLSNNSLFNSALMYAPVGMIRAFGPHPFGAAVALRRRCLAPTVLGSNPRWAFNPYSLGRGARYSGLCPSPFGPPSQAPAFNAPLRGAFVSRSATSPGYLQSTFCRRDYTEKVYLENNRKPTTSSEVVIVLRVFSLLLRL